jgi:hypothetical protein
MQAGENQKRKCVLFDAKEVRIDKGKFKSGFNNARRKRLDWARRRPI